MSHKLTFQEYGQGPVLLLLHGFGGSPQHFKAIAQELASDYRVIVPNLSHLYHSANKVFFSVQVAALAKYIQEQFPEQKVHIAGVSYGGALAWALAARYPHLVQALSLVNPMVCDPVKNFVPLEMKFFFSVPLNLKSTYLMLHSPLGKSFLKKAAFFFRSERVDGPGAIETLEGRKLQFVAHIIHKFAWTLKNEDWSSWSPLLYNFRGDSQMIVCKDDGLFSQDSFQKFAMHIGCENVHTLESGGHLVIRSEPEVIAQLIREFLARQIAA